MKHSPALAELIEALRALPGVGPKTAQRMAFQLLQSTRPAARLLAGALTQALERNKVVEVNPPAGAKFDPHQHQAISVVPAAQEPNTVVAVLQKGYLIADRVLRPALVTVSAPA